jgi:hypothetical protein
VQLRRSVHMMASGFSGSYPAARDLFQLIADAHDEDDACGPEHHDTLAARSSLARWTGEAGCGGAGDRYAALLSVQERVLGPEHPDTLTARANLARLHRGGGGCGRGPRPVRCAAAGGRAGLWRRVPAYAT